ncbi:MAG: thiamine pyrophosphate-binding protein [Eubacterium sp.]|nr:thiamine pyrophosphate-binding protein [Eubacterium sp.]
MKVRVADYIADKLVEYGIRHVFTVTGGGAMYLNDAFGHKTGLSCIYQHHEQACAIAAESYARVCIQEESGMCSEKQGRAEERKCDRVKTRMAAVCVTTGPGGTNALTGVLGAWLDSIPMLILSGQVRYDTTVRNTGLRIRAFGDQEFDIVHTVSTMTKYAEMVTDPTEIRRCLEKAVCVARSGRQGPCWLDIPLDVQGAYIDVDSLEAYDPAEDRKALAPNVSDETADFILDKIQTAKRPVLNAGSGIRTAGAANLLLLVAQQLQIPVVTGWNSIDLIADDNPLYAGRAGIMGDRAGNWAVQSCDVLLSIGSRLSIRQVGYLWEAWAPNAYTIVEDADLEELKKPSIHVDFPVWADAGDLLEALARRQHAARNHAADRKIQREEWIRCCRDWRKRYPVVQAKHLQEHKPANVYAFIRRLSEALPENALIVVGNGSASVVGSQAFVIRRGQRFLINSGAASMGYDLPASIGACIASGVREVVCVTGDGSIQMNLQELQTILHHKLPVKIFVIHNNGYHSIRQTQNHYFEGCLVGVGTDSGDLSFPSMEKLAAAYGYTYDKIESNTQLSKLKKVLDIKGACICEVFVDTKQCFEPKAASKKLANGSIVSRPLEDLSPHLPKEELRQVMKAGWAEQDEKYKKDQHCNTVL